MFLRSKTSARILVLILALATVVAFTPLTGWTQEAYAGTATVTVNGIDVSAHAYWKWDSTLAIPTYVEGTSEDYNIHYSVDSSGAVKLELKDDDHFTSVASSGGDLWVILDNAKMTATDSSAINCIGGYLSITSIGENYISASASAAAEESSAAACSGISSTISPGGDSAKEGLVSMVGTGKLNITAKGHAINADTMLTFQSSSVTAMSTDADTLHSGIIGVSGGRVVANATGKAAIHGANKVIVSGGTVIANGAGEQGIGIESVNGGTEIIGGAVYAHGDSAAMNTTVTVTVDGRDITQTAKGKKYVTTLSDATGKSVLAYASPDTAPSGGLNIGGFNTEINIEGVGVDSVDPAKPYGDYNNRVDLDVDTYSWSAQMTPAGYALTLNNAYITDGNVSTPASASDLSVKLTGTNIIDLSGLNGSAYTSAVKSGRNLTFTGDGTLTATAPDILNNDSACSVGIYAADTLTASGGTVTGIGGDVSATDAYVDNTSYVTSCGVYASSVVVNGGSLTGTGGSEDCKDISDKNGRTLGVSTYLPYGIDDSSDGSIQVTSGTLNGEAAAADGSKGFSMGIRSARMSVSGGTVTTPEDGLQSVGINMQVVSLGNGSYIYGTLDITGGKVNVYGKSVAIRAYGTTISDADVSAVSTAGGGIWVNKDLIINSGHVNVSTAATGIKSDQKQVIINGGIVSINVISLPTQSERTVYGVGGGQENLGKRMAINGGTITITTVGSNTSAFKLAPDLSGYQNPQILAGASQSEASAVSAAQLTSSAYKEKYVKISPYETSYTPPTWKLSFDITNGSCKDGTATFGTDCKLNIQPDKHYTYPKELVVKAGDKTLVAGTDYDYDPATGVLIIKGASITGVISITAACAKNKTDPYFSNVRGASWSAGRLKYKVTKTSNRKSAVSSASAAAARSSKHAAVSSASQSSAVMAAAVRTYGTVTVIRPVKKTYKSIKVPATVTMNGYVYKVRTISAKAFSKSTKLESITVGKYVRSINRAAFYKCSKLATVRFAGKNIRYIGKNAFRTCAQGCTFKIPASKFKAYKKLLLASGLPKGAEIVKVY